MMGVVIMDDVMLPEIDDVMDSLDVMLPDNEYVVAKSKDDEQLVFGWANIALMKDGTIPFDWQGDIVPLEVLEKAAYEYVQFYGQTGEEHQGEAFGKVVESMVFTPQKMACLGIPEGTVHYGWWIGFHIPDKEIFEKIKNGTYKMFSIQGRTKRVKL